MEAPRPARLVGTLVVIAGLLLASGAAFLAMHGDPTSPLFGNVLTVRVIVGLVVWSVLAWAARRVTLGRLPKMRLNSTATLVWGGFRVALFIAAVTLMVSWLLALALGGGVETTLVRALVLVLLVTFFTSIAAGAFFNSMLVVRRWRGGGAQ